MLLFSSHKCPMPLTNVSRCWKINQLINFDHLKCINFYLLYIISRIIFFSFYKPMITVTFVIISDPLATKLLLFLSLSSLLSLIDWFMHLFMHVCIYLFFIYLFTINFIIVMIIIPITIAGFDVIVVVIFIIIVIIV